MLLVLLCISFEFYAQETPKPKPETVKVKTDSSIVRKKHSPTLASTMSAVLPGLGQVYNKKYWKLPIIYGALGGLGYAANFNNIGYQKYKSIFIVREDSLAIYKPSIFKGHTIDEKRKIMEDNSRYNDDIVESEMNKWRRSRDFDIIIMGVVYIFNIIDASVDAHLFDFDVSDDLSLKINPNLMVFNNQQTSVGLKLTFNLK